jgi:hypothetical protein
MEHPAPVFISREQVQELNEKYGWFQFRDAQGEVSNAFANEAIARYERMRAAAPDLFKALLAYVHYTDAGVQTGEADHGEIDLAVQARAAIAKAIGSHS